MTFNYQRVSLMYVCICRAVTASQIQREALDAEGKRSVREINDRLGCGQDCGRCRSSVKQVVQQAQSQAEPKA